MSENNQLITFEGTTKPLAEGYEWFVVRQFTTAGSRRLRHLKFKDFEICICKWQDENLHLFELHRGDIRTMAYCGIKST